MQERAEEVLGEVLKRVTPKRAEHTKVEALAKKLQREVTSMSKRLKVEATVRVEGSVAKDTWLSEEGDIDVFMQVPGSVPHEALGDVCLRVAREATKGSQQIERFAEHPYLEAIVEGVRVNIVPCYATKRGEWLSATDRTPFHTDYVNKRFNEQMRGEVRLLKKFMKSVGVYGAEIKVGGFSGYLCELLILHHGSFLKVMEAFAGLRERMVVDIEDFYGERQGEVYLLFDEPLVVIDPIDRARNVASAVSRQNLYTFVAAAQFFMKNPSLNFFYPSKTVPLQGKRIRKELKKRGSALILVTFGKVDAVPDVLWGQLYKSLRSLHKLVLLNDFSLLREFAWSDEHALNAFGFELEDCCVSHVRKHLGPPLDKLEECERFVAKHMDSEDTVAGPYLEDGRWIVLVNRKFTDACDLLKEKLGDGGRSVGVAEGISQVLRKGFRVLVNEEILEIYEGNGEFAVFLTDFLQGRPKWLELR